MKPNANCVELIDGSVVLVAPKLLQEKKSNVQSPINHPKRVVDNLDLPLNSLIKKEISPELKKKTPTNHEFPRKTSLQHSPDTKNKQISPRKKEQSPTRSSIWSRLREAFSPTVEERPNEFQRKSPRIIKEAELYLPSIAEDFEKYRFSLCIFVS